MARKLPYDAACKTIFSHERLFRGLLTSYGILPAAFANSMLSARLLPTEEITVALRFGALPERWRQIISAIASGETANKLILDLIRCQNAQEFESCLKDAVKSQ